MYVSFADSEEMGHLCVYVDLALGACGHLWYMGVCVCMLECFGRLLQGVVHI